LPASRLTSMGTTTAAAAQAARAPWARLTIGTSASRPPGNQSRSHRPDAPRPDHPGGRPPPPGRSRRGRRSPATALGHRHRAERATNRVPRPPRRRRQLPPPAGSARPRLGRPRPWPLRRSRRSPAARSRPADRERCPTPYLSRRPAGRRPVCGEPSGSRMALRQRQSRPGWPQETARRDGRGSLCADLSELGSVSGHGTAIEAAGPQTAQPSMSRYRRRAWALSLSRRLATPACSPEPVRRRR
jgi:hypothetical protein